MVAPLGPGRGECCRVCYQSAPQTSRRPVPVPPRLPHVLLLPMLLAVCALGASPFVSKGAFGADPQKAAKSPAEQAPAKPRLLVLTDIGGDPDDQQSMIRLMVHANEFDIEGLVASAAGSPGELKADTVKPELIREIVEAYGKVRPNLLKHHPEFPEAKVL